MKEVCLIALLSFVFPLAVHATKTIKKEAIIVKVDGSSTVAPISEAVAEEFQNEKHINVTVGTSGTGGGFKKFCKGETDISDASRPILKKEIDMCKENKISYIELPVAYDALTVMVNPKNTWITSMTISELKKIWEPKKEGETPITRWNQVNPAWPDEPIKLYGAGTDSGTFDYFTEAIVGTAKSSRGDYTASEDDNVLVTGIAGDKNALGYFGFAYYEANRDRLKAVAIDAGKGPVLPSQENVENGTYQPLSRPIFIYVSAQSLKTKPAVKEFAQFYLKHAEKLVKDVRYIPFKSDEYKTIAKRLNKMEKGTVFAGISEVGLKIKDILSRKPKM